MKFMTNLGGGQGMKFGIQPRLLQNCNLKENILRSDLASLELSKGSVVNFDFVLMTNQKYNERKNIYSEFPQCKNFISQLHRILSSLLPGGAHKKYKILYITYRLDILLIVGTK